MSRSLLQRILLLLCWNPPRLVLHGLSSLSHLLLSFLFLAHYQGIWSENPLLPTLLVDRIMWGITRRRDLERNGTHTSHPSVLQVSCLSSLRSVAYLPHHTSLWVICTMPETLAWPLHVIFLCNIWDVSLVRSPTRGCFGVLRAMLSVALLVPSLLRLWVSIFYLYGLLDLYVGCFSFSHFDHQFYLEANKRIPERSGSRGG